MLILDPPHTPRPWGPGEDLVIQRVIRLLQATSSHPSAVTPGARGAFCMRASKLLSPPPSLGVMSQLCDSSVSRPNSALGRGGIRNPVSRGVALANQRLRLLGHRGSHPCAFYSHRLSPAVQNYWKHWEQGATAGQARTRGMETVAGGSSGSIPGLDRS